MLRKRKKTIKKRARRWQKVGNTRLPSIMLNKIEEGYIPKGRLKIRWIGEVRPENK